MLLQGGLLLIIGSELLIHQPYYALQYFAVLPSIFLISGSGPQATKGLKIWTLVVFLY